MRRGLNGDGEPDMELVQKLLGDAVRGVLGDACRVDVKSGVDESGELVKKVLWVVYSDRSAEAGAYG